MPACQSVTALQGGKDHYPGAEGQGPVMAPDDLRFSGLAMAKMDSGLLGHCRASTVNRSSGGHKEACGGPGEPECPPQE